MGEWVTSPGLSLMAKERSASKLRWLLRAPAEGPGRANLKPVWLHVGGACQPRSTVGQSRQGWCWERGSRMERGQGPGPSQQPPGPWGHPNKPQGRALPLPG